MAWLKSDTNLERHDKLILFRRQLRWSKNEAVGFLHRFWWTVLQYAPTGDVAALSPVVIGEQLDMPADLVTRAINVMEDAEIALLTRDGPHLLVTNWLEYAGGYLRDSLFRRHPEKWEATCRLYGVSADSPPTDGRLSAVDKRRGDKKRSIPRADEWAERELAKLNGNGQQEQHHDPTGSD